jgi:ATP-dependent RNA helicase HelY
MLREFPVVKILEFLSDDNLLPAILFRSARRQCDADLQFIGRMRRGRLNEKAQRELRQEIHAVIDRYSFPPEVILEHPQYQGLVETGVGAHHAGQLLPWRLLLEELMSRGVLRMLIATGTVAAGVDFPARSVVITAHSKAGADGFRVLTSSEFMQMSGRAGRRGKDAVGICLVAPSQLSDARVIHDIANKPAEPLTSAYFASPSTVLNLLKFRNVDDLEYTVQRSLAAFLDRKHAKHLRDEAVSVENEVSALAGEASKRARKRLNRMIREADAVETRQEMLLKQALNGLRILGFIDPERGGLTEKGTWAAELCTTLVLEIAEAIHEFVFEDLPMTQLAGLVASIAGDAHRSYFNLKPNPIPKERYQKLQEIVDRVKRSYDNPTAAETMVLPDAALTVMTWMECESWAEFSSLLRLARVADGDISRLVTQTADHLNQIVRLRVTHPELAKLAQEARQRLLRPPLTDIVGVE